MVSTHPSPAVPATQIQGGTYVEGGTRGVRPLGMEQLINRWYLYIALITICGFLWFQWFSSSHWMDLSCNLYILRCSSAWFHISSVSMELLTMALLQHREGEVKSEHPHLHFPSLTLSWPLAIFAVHPGQRTPRPTACQSRWEVRQQGVVPGPDPQAALGPRGMTDVQTPWWP